MKILCLYNNEIAVELFEWMRSLGHEMVIYSERLHTSWCLAQSFDLTVSYTYRYILTQEVIGDLNNNVVNIHNSYLPWNRGADPNIWSIIDDTPRGVTLHYIDSQLDHGDIIAQTLLSPPLRQGVESVEYENNVPTLSSTYDDLDKAAKQLFKDAFQYYSFWNRMRKSTSQGGFYHRASEARGIKDAISSYDISITKFKSLIGGDIGGIIIVVMSTSSLDRRCA